MKPQSTKAAKGRKELTAEAGRKKEFTELLR